MATDELSRLTSWADGLLASMEPAARRQLAGEMARTLRASQAQRIRANLQPDGSPMAPRKPQPKLKKGRGRLRHEMLRQGERAGGHGAHLVRSGSATGTLERSPGAHEGARFLL